MERVFGTLQSRLPPELRLAEIATVEAANRYLKEQFVPDYNARFAVPAAEEGSAFIPYAGRPLDDILCIQESRQVGRDNCVNWNRLALQIPPQRHRHHYVRATVRVHQYPDGRLAIFRWPELPRAVRPGRKADRCLARCDSARRRRPDGPVDNAARSPQPHRPSNNRSGHLTRYDTRTSSRATDRG